MSNPIPENHYRFVFPGGTTKDLSNTHKFFQTIYGQALVGFRSRGGNQDRSIQINKTQAVFQKYLSALDDQTTNPPTVTEIDPRDYVEIVEVADFYNDGKMIEKVKRQASGRLNFDEISQKINDQGRSVQEREFWVQAYFQKVLNQPVDQWERLLGEVALEEGLTLDALLNQLGGEDQGENISTDSVRKLYAYYLSKPDALGSLYLDYDQIVEWIQGLTNSDEKKNLLTGLIELSVRCLEKQVGTIGSNASNQVGSQEERLGIGATIFGWVKDWMKLIKNGIPPRPIQDGIQAWKTIRSINKYEAITESFLSRATEQLSQEHATALRGRVDQLQISLRFPWGLGRANTASIDQHRTNCARQIVITVARTVAVLVTGIFVIIALGLLKQLSMLGFIVSMSLLRNGGESSVDGWMNESTGILLQVSALMGLITFPFFGFKMAKDLGYAFVTALLAFIVLVLTVSIHTLEGEDQSRWRYREFLGSSIGQKVSQLADRFAPTLRKLLDIGRPDRIRINV